MTQGEIDRHYVVYEQSRGKLYSEMNQEEQEAVDRHREASPWRMGSKQAEKKPRRGQGGGGRGGGRGGG